MERKILIVDDDEQFLQIITDKLKSEGFSVLAVTNGAEAISVSMAEHPDLILLDILMPKMGGLEVMQKLRGADEWGRQVPIFLVTSVDPDDAVLKAVADNKPTYYLMKGELNLHQMVEKIKEQLHPS